MGRPGMLLSLLCILGRRYNLPTLVAFRNSKMGLSIAELSIGLLQKEHVFKS